MRCMYYYAKRKIVFSPTRTTVQNFRDKVTNFYLNVDNIQCHTQYHAINDKSDVLLYLHGTNNNLSCRGYVVEMAKMIDINLVLIDYSGYGLSSGRADLINMENCGIKAVEWILTMGYKIGDIRVWGESIGSIAASKILSSYKCHSGIILFGISSFEDIITYSDLPCKKILKWIPRWFTPPESNKDRYKKLKAPILFLHSPIDNVVPYEGVKKMVEELNLPLITIDGLHSKPKITQEQLSKVIYFMGLKVKSNEYLKEWCEKFPYISDALQFRVIDY